MATAKKKPIEPNNEKTKEPEKSGSVLEDEVKYTTLGECENARQIQRAKRGESTTFGVEFNVLDEPVIKLQLWFKERKKMEVLYSLVEDGDFQACSV